jgi:PilZ domain
MAIEMHLTNFGDDMTTTLADWDELKIDANRERRQEPRSIRKVPIEVCGFNRHGRFFSEKTTTFDVSDGGCRFLLRTDVEKESVVAIRVITRRNGQETDSRPVLFQVNWSKELPDGFTLGASKLQPGAMWAADLSATEKVSRPNA